MSEWVEFSKILAQYGALGIIAYCYIKMTTKQASTIAEEYKKLIDNLIKTQNNKHLKSWFGKSLSLSINCYDMGTYYLDSTVNFLKEKGMQPKNRSAEVVNNANKAINELRKEIAKFFG